MAETPTHWQTIDAWALAKAREELYFLAHVGYSRLSTAAYGVEPVLASLADARQLRPMSTVAAPLLRPGMHTRVVAIAGQGLAGFAAERDRWILWIPVLLGFGVAVYFGLPEEPPAWVGPSLAVGAAASILVLPGRAAARSTWLWPASAGVLAMVAGFAAAQVKAVAVGTEMLSGRLGPTLVTGRVDRVENFPDGQRLTLHRPTIAGLSGRDTPEAARIRLRGNQPPIRPGDRISLSAVLGPPPPPAVPGAYDFQRQAYFDGLGAVGYPWAERASYPLKDDLAFASACGSHGCGPSSASAYARTWQVRPRR